MALQTPVLNEVPVFDATKPYTFTFEYYGASQITQNTLTIRKTQTLEVVYQQTVNTYSYAHTLPASTLQNNETYVATISVGGSGQTSANSQGQYVFCYLTPTFEFSNISDGAEVQNNSYLFDVRYDSEGLYLDSMVMYLYDSNQDLITQSNNITDFSPPPLVASYLFSGFSNDSSYYVRAVGNAGGMVLDTGLVGFSVNYSSSDLYSALELKNNCQDGNVKITSNVKGVGATSEPSPPIYLNNSAVDLRIRIWDEDSFAWVEYNSGFEINGDFTAKFWFGEDTINTPFTFSSTDGSIISVNLDARVNSDGDVEKVAILRVAQNGYVYVAQSNIIIDNPTARQKNYIMVRRVNNIYQIQIKDRG